MFSEIVLTISKNKKVIQAMDNNQLYNQYSAEYRQANDYHGQLPIMQATTITAARKSVPWKCKTPTPA